MQMVRFAACSAVLAPLLCFGISVRAVTAAGTTTFQPGLHGVQVDFTDAQKCGATIQRAFISWDTIEPTKGHYDFSHLDQMVTGAGNLGIDTAVTLVILSSWGSSASTQSTDQSAQQQGGNVSTGNKVGYPTDINAWLTTAGLLAERYDGDGRNDMPGLRRPVNYWQVDNEISWQWVDPMPQYISLLNQTRSAIQQANPNAQIILGAFTATDDLALDAGLITNPNVTVTDSKGNKVTPGSLRTDSSFQNIKARADELYSQAGPYCDIVDFHSYTEDPHVIPYQITWMHWEMQKYKYDKPVWSTENAGPDPGYTDNGQTIQVVQRLALAFGANAGAVFWSTLKPTEGFSQNYIDLALLQQYSGRPKAAYTAYQTVAPILSKSDTATRLQASNTLYLYQFTGRGATIGWIGWCSQGSQTVTIKATGISGVKATSVPTFQSQQSRVTGGSFQVPLSTSPLIIQPN